MINYSLGALLTLLVLIDILWTTLWIDGGAGPVSSTVAKLSWVTTRKLSRVHKKIFGIVGPITLMLTLMSWVFLLWIGVALFFSGNPYSISHQSSEGPAVWYEFLYFSGYTIFTLGLGDYSPQAGFWQVMTAFVSGVGMLHLTLSASYVISIISAIVQKRALSRTISGIGKTSSDFLQCVWNGEDFHQLDIMLNDMSSTITQLNQQNHAFPLLNYYYTDMPEKSSAVTIAVLDEALTLIDFGLKDKRLINTTIMAAAQSSIGTYLDTVTDEYGYESEELPPIPNITHLKELDVPIVSEDEFKEKLKSISKRRRQLLGVVISEEQEWPN
ncbi:ion channel [Alkalibacterium sp. MB6]|uniref:ion channel n=1 Tax=Alkalibacterium sp. MB6 TaxID=2081965 RepID=UPI00137A96BD|nr:ion channel [Alkalibacterium sp. MB6]